jgi:hypothetical protein
MSLCVWGQLNLREKLRSGKYDPEDRLSPAAVSLLIKGTTFGVAFFGFILIGNILHMAIDVYVWLS